MNRKTASIIVVAGLLVATAIILGSGRRGTQTVAGPTPPPRIPVVGASCGRPAPASTSADFGAGTMGVTLSSGTLLQGNGDAYAQIDLATRAATLTQRPPMNVAVVVDRSGSMSGEKLARAIDAARGLVSRLGPLDRVAVVQYDDTAQVLVPAVALDDVGRARILAALSTIREGGSTNLHDGLALGRDEALRELGGGRIARVILLSDGQANVGVTDIPSLSRVSSDASEKGVRITTIGLGLDYNEDLMEAVAIGGRGQYYFVENADGLEKVFAGELKAMEATVATAVEVRLDPACDGVEIVEVFGLATRRDGKSLIVRLPDLAGSEQRRLIVKLKVPAEKLGHTGVLQATLSFNAATGGAHRDVTALIGAEISGDAAAVAAAIDREVMSRVEQIEAARAIKEASAYYDRGDVSGAQTILRRQRAATAENAKKLGYTPAQAAPSMGALDMAEEGYTKNAPGSAGGKAATKANKANAYDMLY